MVVYQIVVGLDFTCRLCGHNTPGVSFYSSIPVGIKISLGMVSPRLISRIADVPHSRPCVFHLGGAIQLRRCRWGYECVSHSKTGHSPDIRFCPFTCQFGNQTGLVCQRFGLPRSLISSSTKLRKALSSACSLARTPGALDARPFRRSQLS